MPKHIKLCRCKLTFTAYDFIVCLQFTEKQNRFSGLRSVFIWKENGHHNGV